MKSNIPIVLAVAALVAPLLGVALGALLTRRSEHRRWLRESRREAYARFLTSGDRVRALLLSDELDEGEVDEATTELGNAFSDVVLVGSDALHREAYDLIGILLSLKGAREPAFEGRVPSKTFARGVDLSVAQRWKVIEEARKDLQVKPAALPTQVQGEDFASFQKELLGE